MPKDTGRWAKIDKLLDYLSGLGSAVVAFSGGIDSSFLLWACLKALGKGKTLAVTFASPLMREDQKEKVCLVIRTLKADHLWLETDELSWPEFVINDSRRCYYCKKNRYSLLWHEMASWGHRNLIDGTNFSDLMEIRPGLEAVKELGVLTPLVETEWNKEDIILVSKELGLPSAEYDPESCLATRVAQGQKISREMLMKVADAEKELLNLGFHMVRARLRGEEMILQVRPDEVARLLSMRNRLDVLRKRLNLRCITIDPAGYRKI